MARNDYLQVRLNENERTVLVCLAQRDGVSISEYVRGLVRDEARRLVDAHRQQKEEGRVTVPAEPRPLYPWEY
jgi:phosphoglycerate dehydrogenase-like enzyme